jgi:hypothetical protein
MVVGLDRFRTHFADFADQYVLIGGTATFLVLDEAGLDARMTRDLDIVLCVEALESDFIKAFWAFVHAGGYQNQQRSTGKKVFCISERRPETAGNRAAGVDPPERPASSAG